MALTYNVPGLVDVGVIEFLLAVLLAA